MILIYLDISAILFIDTFRFFVPRLYWTEKDGFETGFLPRRILGYEILEKHGKPAKRVVTYFGAYLFSIDLDSLRKAKALFK